MKSCQIISLSVLAFLTACGGSGSGGSVTSRSVTGQVVDGYVQGAKVCLDSNGNDTCDSGEPTTTTSDQGSYTLQLGSGDTSGKRIIVEVPVTAKDSDDGGLTLQEAGKAAYVMSTTTDQPTYITPFTTMAVEKIKSGVASTMVDASTKVAADLGLSGAPDLLGNPMNSSTLHTNARQIAQLLQTNSGSSQTPTAALSQSLQNIKNNLPILPGGLNGALADLGQAVSATLSGIPTGKLLTYKMPKAKDGQPIDATAMLFTPAGTAPTTGWPLIVLATGTTGVDTSCAPSNGYFGYSVLLGSLLNSGMAVVVPDYEGRGPKSTGQLNAHPYLNLLSAGRSMSLAALASKNQLESQLSGAWAIVGHSQGGHAALATAQLSSLAKDMSYKGAVAIAPASGFIDTISKDLASGNPEQITAVNTFSSYMVLGSTYTSSPIDYTTVFGANMQTIHKQYSNQCLTPYMTAIAANVTSYALLNPTAIGSYPGILSVSSDSINGKILVGNEPGQVKLTGQTLIMQGDSDTTVLKSATDSLVNSMTANGSQVTYKVYPSQTHQTVMTNQADILDFLSNLFK